MPYIYQLRNTENGKRYIGQTKDLAHRKACHFHELKKGIHKSEAMQADYDQNNGSIVFEVVCECPEQELDELERFFIAKYKAAESGYNKSPGRTPNGGNIASESTRRKASLAKMGNQHMKGKRLSDEWRRNLAEAQPHRKRVRCVDTGEVYESFADAARKTGLHRTCIVSVCTGHQKTTQGLRFEYAD